VIVARVIRTIRDQGGESILQVGFAHLAASWQDHPNAFEGRATADTPSMGVARRATHALRSAPCSRPSDTLS
jgi:hypothetical protein